MKKSIIILTAVMCLFVSCGNKNNSDNDTENNSESISETTQEPTFVTEVITDAPKLISDEEEGYEELINTYRQCLEKNEIGNMMKLSYPDKYFDIFSLMAEMSGMTVGEVMGIVQGSASNTIKITEIISDEPMEDYETLTNKLVDIYGEYQVISDYIDEQGGKDKIDEDAFNEFIDNADYDSENISLYFEPKDAHIINCNIASTVESDDENVEPQVLEYEQKFILYYIDGEGWKMDTYTSDSE